MVLSEKQNRVVSEIRKSFKSGRGWLTHAQIVSRTGFGVCQVDAALQGLQRAGIVRRLFADFQLVELLNKTRPKDVINGVNPKQRKKYDARKKKSATASVAPVSAGDGATGKKPGKMAALSKTLRDKSLSVAQASADDITKERKILMVDYLAGYHPGLAPVLAAIKQDLEGLTDG